MNITEIRDSYHKGFYSYKSTEVIPRKLPENHIFDADLTVRRNRELVFEHNQKIDNLIKEKSDRQTALNKKLTEDVIEYIQESYNFSRKQAQIVESFVYSNYHSCMWDYFCYIDTVADFVDSFIHCEEDI